MNARRDLYAALMSGGPHSPERSEKASALIDAFKAEVLADAARPSDEPVHFGICFTNVRGHRAVNGHCLYCGETAEEAAK